MVMGSDQNAPDINMPEDLALPVIDHYDTTISQEVIDNAAETNPSIKDMTQGQITAKIKELFESQGYQQKINALAEQTNKKLEPIVDSLE